MQTETASGIIRNANGQMPLPLRWPGGGTLLAGQPACLPTTPGPTTELLHHRPGTEHMLFAPHLIASQQRHQLRQHCVPLPQGRHRLVSGGGSVLFVACVGRAMLQHVVHCSISGEGCCCSALLGAEQLDAALHCWGGAIWSADVWLSHL